MRWAGKRNIRVVVKGTGHDLYGRSTGANSLPIWTHNFRQIHYQPAFVPSGAPPDFPTEKVAVAGSGLSWKDVYGAMSTRGRVFVGGAEGTVGLGGHIQGGGHGPLSSYFGLAANNVLQASMVTPKGEILVVNEFQNQHLFFAIRGGGPGNFGVVTEFVLKSYPTAPIVSATVFMAASNSTRESRDAMWNATASVTSSLPALIVKGVSGALFITAGQSASKSVTPSFSVPEAPTITGTLSIFNSNGSAFSSIVDPVFKELTSSYGSSVTIVLSNTTTCPNLWDCIRTQPSQPVSVSEGLLSSRLLSHRALTIPQHHIVSHLQRLLTPGAILIHGLVAGSGPANIPPPRRGATLPAWRNAYLHSISVHRVPVAPQLSPKTKLAEFARFQNEHVEPAWRDWAPEAGSYMNEANAFAETWKSEIYGENYEELGRVKRVVDPKGLLWVQGGVGSDEWVYDVDSGRLCRARHAG